MEHGMLSSIPNIPQHAQILVIGGGPSGSYAATALAREGMDVVLLEAAIFPRYHIGESMLPSIRPFLRFIDAEDKFIKHGFEIKRGAAVKFNQFKREGYTDFIALNPDHGSWNVIRSEFDELLLRHAEDSRVNVFEGQSVTDIEFNASGRPIRANCKSQNGLVQGISFDYLVDASGRTGIMSTKYLKNRKMNASLKNIAWWGYWRGAAVYMPGTSRHNAPWFEALTDESGWGWFIPLHDGTGSVGIVMDMSVSRQKRQGKKGKKDYSLKQHYLDQLNLVPGIKRLLEDATLREDGPVPAVQSASDFSYSAKNYAGDHYRLIGDAAGKVHLAFAGGFSAATSIAASIRGHCTETDAAKFHDAKVGTSYTRFLLVVMGAYKQIRAQSLPVLSDINEDNFDRAFDRIRPIIQGTADVEKRLSVEELAKTMDFVTSVLVTPTDPEMFESVSKRVLSDLLSPRGKFMLEDDINKVVEPGDDDAKCVLREVNARKAIHGMYDGPIHLAAESIDGMFGIAKRGSLGISVII